MNFTGFLSSTTTDTTVLHSNSVHAAQIYSWNVSIFNHTMSFVTCGKAKNYNHTLRISEYSGYVQENTRLWISKSWFGVSIWLAEVKVLLYEDALVPCKVSHTEWRYYVTANEGHSGCFICHEENPSPLYLLQIYSWTCRSEHLRIL